MPDVLVVGAGQAGVQLACSLRELGVAGRVTVVGAEPHRPYQRPPLSKAFLAGTATADSLALRSPEFFREHDVELVLGERLASLDLDAGRARTEQGRRLGVEQLALATGARPRRLGVPGGDLPGVLVLRDLDDAARLAAALPGAQRVVVVGGGFIGLEAAAVCRAKGKEVTVVEALDRLMARAVAPVVSAFYLSAHERRGSTVLLGHGVAEVTGCDRVTGVLLDDGTRIPADLVLVGVGVEPRTELAQALGLEVDRGVVVDACLRTSDPRVVAVGDVAVLPSPQDPSQRVRLESVQNAVDSAKAAAATLAGTPAPYTALPWFWSEQFDLRLQIAGLSTGYDDVVLRGDPASEAFSALYFRAGTLIAVDSVNRTPDYMAARRALAKGAVALSRAEAADVAVPLKQLLADRAA